MRIFQQDDANLIKDGYQGLYDSDSEEYWQSCTVVAKIYETKDGEPVDKDMNRAYWNGKGPNGATTTVQTGFRVWKKASESKWNSAADAEKVEYNLYDFGIEKPAEPEKEKQTEEQIENIEDGAAGSLSTIAATIIALSLIF